MAISFVCSKCNKDCREHPDMCPSCHRKNMDGAIQYTVEERDKSNREVQKELFEYRAAFLKVEKNYEDKSMECYELEKELHAARKMSRVWKFAARKWRYTAHCHLVRYRLSKGRSVKRKRPPKPNC